ncbi:unnamed protein product [Thelazia callipaeda]|uniref:Uncharacterized protein n=1 Tax=Thelazia callipaeda TaxID=103827 RepID=A0A0N5D555_THECL|nr:unnamed protein product [Thelazia callipaeda]
MSMPRMCSLPSSSGSANSTSVSTGDKEKQRFAVASATMAFPGLPFMAAAFPAITPTTTGSSVFPNHMAAQLSLFNPHLQQYYANFLHQQQILQSLQNHSPQSRAGPFFSALILSKIVYK